MIADVFKSQKDLARQDGKRVTQVEVELDTGVKPVYSNIKLKTKNEERALLEIKKAQKNLNKLEIDTGDPIPHTE